MVGVKYVFLLLFCICCIPLAIAAPSAVNDSAQTNESVTIVINLTGNDAGSNLRIGQLSLPNNATVVDNGDGTVNFTPEDNFFGTSTFNYTLLESGLYSNDTGHYYEFVTALGISWTDAMTNASQRNFSGLQGYLVTIGSQAENDFVAERLSGQGWMGASDAAVEDEWRWVTGPENGTQFWQGLGDGSIVDGLYNNWAFGEPNNAGGEDYAHFLADGQWNDYPHSPGGSIEGYVVEYGGLEGDVATFSYGYVTVNVSPVAPTVTIVAPAATTYNLTNNISLNVSSSKSISSWWYDINGTNVTFTPNTSLVLDNANYTLTIYANASHNNLTGSASVSFVVDFVDDDGDGVADIADTLVGETINSSGVSDVNITVNGSSTNGSFTGTQTVQISDGTTILVNLSHNFSQSALNLSAISIVKSSLGMVINTSGQITGGKTIYVADPGFVTFCVKDAQIDSVDDISSGCSDPGETDFTSCLGANATIGNVTCTDLGSTLQVDNLTHSGAKGTLAESESPSSSSSRSSSGGGFTVRCGDNRCMATFGETCSSCALDCGVCPAVAADVTDPSALSSDADGMIVDELTAGETSNLSLVAEEWVSASTDPQVELEDEQIVPAKNGSRLFWWIIPLLVLLAAGYLEAKIHRWI